MIMPIAVAMLALTSGLAAACFVKAFGITFLAHPALGGGGGAHEAPLSMQCGMAALVAACVALGLAPFLVVPALGALAGFHGLRAAPVRFPCRCHSGRPAPSARCRRSCSPRASRSSSASRLRAPRAGRRSETARGRHVGLRTDRADAAHGVHRHRFRRAAAAGVRGALPADRGPVDRLPSRVQYFVQSIEYHSEIPPWFESALYAPSSLAVRLRAARAPPAVGLAAPLSRSIWRWRSWSCS